MIRNYNVQVLQIEVIFKLQTFMIYLKSSLHITQLIDYIILIKFLICQMSQQSSAERVYEKILSLIQENPQRNQNILVQTAGPRMNIKFNRPKRYNAFSIDMYFTLSEALKEAQQNDSIKFIILMGEGGNFSSGNDLTNFTNPSITGLGDFEDVLKASSKFLKDLTDTIITCKKPIIALTQGKTIGFTFTMLGLLDKVFSVDSTSFVAPLVSSAQGPELCASYTFPKIFGKSIAEELITFGKQVNAEYLEKFNFVQRCKSVQEANEKLTNYLNKIDELDWESYVNARRLYKEREEKILLEVNNRQLENLIQRWLNPNLLTYIAKHMQKMKKSPKL